MASTAMVRSGGSVVSSMGSVSPMRAGIATLKVGGLMAVGYAAAEVGSGLLRQGIRQVDTFATGGKLQEAFVKLLPGGLVAIFLAAMAYKAARSSGASPVAAAGAASKVVVCVGVGVVASMVRRPVGDFVDDLTSKIRTTLLGAGSAAPSNVIDMKAAKGAGGVNDGFYFSRPDNGRAGGRPLSDGGRPNTTPSMGTARAGGDAGWTAPTPFDPRDVAMGDVPHT